MTGRARTRACAAVRLIATQACEHGRKVRDPRSRRGSGARAARAARQARDRRACSPDRGRGSSRLVPAVITATGLAARRSQPGRKPPIGDPHTCRHRHTGAGHRRVHPFEHLGRERVVAAEVTRRATCGKVSRPGSCSSTRGVNVSTARAIFSKARASALGSASSTTASPQHASASRRRMPARTPSALASCDAARTILCDVHVRGPRPARHTVTDRQGGRRRPASRRTARNMSAMCACRYLVVTPRCEPCSTPARQLAQHPSTFDDVDRLSCTTRANHHPRRAGRQLVPCTCTRTVASAGHAPRAASGAASSATSTVGRSLRPGEEPARITEREAWRHDCDDHRHAVEQRGQRPPASDRQAHRARPQPVRVQRPDSAAAATPKVDAPPVSTNAPHSPAAVADAASSNAARYTGAGAPTGRAAT